MSFAGLVLLILIPWLIGAWTIGRWIFKWITDDPPAPSDDGIEKHLGRQSKIIYRSCIAAILAIIGLS